MMSLIDLKTYIHRLYVGIVMQNFLLRSHILTGSLLSNCLKIRHLERFSPGRASPASVIGRLRVEVHERKVSGKSVS